MKKLFSLLLTLSLFIALFAFSGCSNTDNLVIKESDEYIVITISSEQMEIDKNSKLIDYMHSLKEDGLLDFEVTGGMITAVNGIKNPSDWSSCWMLYTDDEEFSSQVYGTVEYNGKIYQSAILGAESLPVKDGAVYIWIFKAF